MTWLFRAVTWAGRILAVVLCMCLGVYISQKVGVSGFEYWVVSFIIGSFILAPVGLMFDIVWFAYLRNSKVLRRVG